ncbi:MAG: hypothetical protein KF789_03015 [Bdellovibrionaceae bacterium]|nr:hypothetical protein [Pseudobdellovibrionaceae bacterium]
MKQQLMKRTVLSVALGFGLMACSQGQNFSLPSQSNNFGQNIIYNNKVDVIFVVDNSSGMDQVNANWRAAVPTLVNSLLGQKLDLHMAVVTSSMGGTNPNGGKFLGTPKFFTSRTSNLASAITQRISEVGTDGSDLERGLDSLSRVLKPSYQTGEGAGFLREDALLAVISLSTEDDKSSDYTGSAGFAAYLDQIKGTYDDGTRRWTLNFIGILSLSGGCATVPEMNYREPGVRWLDLATLSNGVTASICSTDLSAAAKNIRARIAQIITDFKLSKIPQLETVKVYLNGKLISRSSENGWDYVPERNVIRFYGSAIPSADADIRIDFTPASAN